MTIPSNLIDDLEDAISGNSTERRSEMLLRIVDLFAVDPTRYSGDQIALFDDIICRLETKITLSVRVELARQLASISNAPPTIVRKLATDEEITVAGPILSQSNSIDDAFLVGAAKAAGQKHLFAISKRKQLSEAITDIIVERGTADVLQSVAENDGANFSQTGYATLITRSESDEALALAIGSRSRLPRHLFLMLVARASENVRKKLQKIDPQSAGELQHIVTRIADRIVPNQEGAPRTYVDALAAARGLHSVGRLHGSAIEQFARECKFEEVVAALSLLCDLPVEVVENALVQERSEPLLILARAIGLTWSTVRALLLMRAGKRGLSPQALEQCVVNFERLKQETAQNFMRLQRRRIVVGAL